MCAHRFRCLATRHVQWAFRMNCAHRAVPCCVMRHIAKIATRPLAPRVRVWDIGCAMGLMIERRLVWHCAVDRPYTHAYIRSARLRKSAQPIFRPRRTKRAACGHHLCDGELAMKCGRTPVSVCVMCVYVCVRACRCARVSGRECVHVSVCVCVVRRRPSLSSLLSAHMRICFHVLPSRCTLQPGLGELVMALRASHRVFTVWDAISKVFVYGVLRWHTREPSSVIHIKNDMFMLWEGGLELIWGSAFEVRALRNRTCIIPRATILLENSLE